MEFQDKIRESVTKHMSMRDWFAGMAMSGDIASMGNMISIDEKALAEWSYKVADAMMEARKIVVELSEDTGG